MKYIFLIGNSGFDINTLTELNYKNVKCRGYIDDKKTSYSITFNHDEYIVYDALDLNNETREEFEDSFTNVPFSSPVVVMMTYSSEQCLKEILIQKDFPDVYIDNDHSLAVSLAAFIQMGFPLK